MMINFYMKTQKLYVSQNPFQPSDPSLKAFLFFLYMMSLGRNVSNFYRNDKQYVLYSHRTDRLGQLVKWYHTVIDIPRL